MLAMFLELQGIMLGKKYEEDRNPEIPVTEKKEEKHKAVRHKTVRY